MANDLFGYSIIGFFAGLFFFVKGIIWLREKQIIENIPTSTVRSLAMGLVEIAGTVTPQKGTLLTSPFTNTDCVYYKYVVEELRHAKNTSYWVTVREDEERTRFFLKDKTGKVLVDTTGADISVPASYSFDSTMGRDPPKKVLTFLKANNIRFEGLLGINKTMRYREYVLTPGEQLYILGTAGKNPDVKESAVHEDMIMIQKGKHEKFYFISNSSERDMLKNYQWKVIGGIGGGILLTVACLAYLLFFWGLL